MDKTEKPRLDYLDFVKCITIFLVIWGHTADSDPEPLYRIVLYSFHMPLFFLVSGMVTSRHRHEYNREHWKKFLYKNGMALLVPYFLWGLIYSNFSYSNMPKLLYASWEVLNQGISLTSLWYLPCLFVARVMAEAVLMLSWKVPKIPRHLFAFLVSVPAFAIGFLLPKASSGYPLCVNIAFMALGFIMLGYAAKELIAKLPKDNALIFLPAFFVFGGILFVSFLIQGENPFIMKMCSAGYGDPFLFFLDSFAGIGMVFSFSLFLVALFRNAPENRARSFMLWTGRNTIGIYLLHKPFLMQVVMPSFAALGAVLPSAWWGLAGAVIAFLFSIAGCRIINRFVPSLFGRF